MDLFPSNRFVYELKPSDFDSAKTYKLKDPQCSVVFFYCHWCPHCRNLQETWVKLAKIAGFMKVCAFNCEKYKEHIIRMNEEKELVKGYPTIIFYKKGIPVEKYNDERTEEKLLATCMDMCQK